MERNTEMDVETLCALGQLVAGAAHKLNNSLTSVRGYADLIHEDLHDLASEDERAVPIAEEAGILKTEIHNAARTISLLADFGRVKGGQPVEDPASLLEGVVALAGYGLQRVGCRFTITAGPGLPIVTESATALRRTLLFTILLCQRALDGRAAGAEVRIAMQPQEAGVRVCIAHDGSGPVDDESTRKRLDACAALAADRGGRFVAEAGNGQMTYTFELPA